MNALSALKYTVSLHELMISQIVSDHINPETSREWELSSASQNMPKPETIPFLEKKCKALKIIYISHESRSAVKHSSAKMVQQKLHQSHMSVTSNCLCCKETHPFYRCSSFRAMDPQWCFQFMKQAKLCFNCCSKTPLHTSVWHFCVGRTKPFAISL
jgi:hypothetical protein